MSKLQKTIFSVLAIIFTGIVLLGLKYHFEPLGLWERASSGPVKEAT